MLDFVPSAIPDPPVGLEYLGAHLLTCPYPLKIVALVYIQWRLVNITLKPISTNQNVYPTFLQKLEKIFQFVRLLVDYNMHRVCYMHRLMAISRMCVCVCVCVCVLKVIREFSYIQFLFFIFCQNRQTLFVIFDLWFNLMSRLRINHVLHKRWNATGQCNLCRFLIKGHLFNSKTMLYRAY